MSTLDKSYVADRKHEYWSLYFDFDDFSTFKTENPEFLDWLDHPEDNINEMLKAQSSVDKPKIDWDTFEFYHNEVITFIDFTQEKLLAIQEQATFGRSATNKMSEDRATEVMPLANMKMNRNVTENPRKMTQRLAAGLNIKQKSFFKGLGK